MSHIRLWVDGARPRTLTTAVTPVAVGAASAISLHAHTPLLTFIALALAIALQVGVNYANDYSDGVRGTDATRVGPTRLVASGAVRPSVVRRAAFLAFGIAATLGLTLVVLSGAWLLLPIGALSIAAAWGYTGGPRPYGYAGWGEVMVFVFFGPVATLGTVYVHAGFVTWWTTLASMGVGLWAVALLLVNNVRDAQTDAASGKNTLVVAVGERWGRLALAACVMAPLLIATAVAFARPWSLITLLTLLPSVLIAITAVSGLRGGGLRPVFTAVSATGLAYGLLLAFGIALG